MTDARFRHAVRVNTPEPFGEVTLVPSAVSGRSEAELARSMAQALIETGPATGANALRILRRVFPGSPLTTRIAALDAVMRR